MTDLSVIAKAIQGATDDLREANRLADARTREITSYVRDALRGQNNEWSYFSDNESAICLLEIFRAMKLPGDAFRESVERSLIRLIERNAETHADIMEREHRL
jgi:hypothetical protein